VDPPECPPPDHSTIARFQNNERLTGIIEALFYQITEKLYELGELPYNNIFTDGTKIEANANRCTFVWAKGTIICLLTFHTMPIHFSVATQYCLKSSSKISLDKLSNVCYNMCMCIHIHILRR